MEEYVSDTKKKELETLKSLIVKVDPNNNIYKETLDLINDQLNPPKEPQDSPKQNVR